MNMAPISIQTLVEHYVQKELGEDSSKTYAKLFYVAASRGRQEITVITSDREQLRESLGISTARSSVMELARSLAHEHDSRVRDAAQNPATHLERSTPHYREIACDHSLGMGL
jgi:hypothetical protein